MAASAQQIWALISDITNTGRFSPETFEAEWLDNATIPAIGVRFRGHVKRNGRGPVYWTTCRIVACEPSRVFGFEVLRNDKAVISWHYLLEPKAGSTAVTESFELSDSRLMKCYWAIAGRARSRTNRRGMQTTLERIKAVVEAD